MRTSHASIRPNCLTTRSASSNGPVKKSAPVGDYIWMQHNGDFIHIHKDKLIGASNEEIREEIFIATVGQAIADELAQAKADLAVAERLAKQVPALQQAIEDLKGKISAINEINDEGLLRLSRQYIDKNHRRDNTHYLKITNNNIYFDSGEIPSVANGSIRVIELGNLQLHGIDQERINEINRMMNDIADKAYEAGYKAGYVDGYNQAVKDLNA